MSYWDLIEEFRYHVAVCRRLAARSKHRWFARENALAFLAKAIGARIDSPSVLP